jgi:hypothetical protein
MRGQNPLYGDKTPLKTKPRQQIQVARPQPNLQRETLVELHDHLQHYIGGKAWRQISSSYIEQWSLEKIREQLQKDLSLQLLDDEHNEATEHLLNHLAALAVADYRKPYNQLSEEEKKAVLANAEELLADEVRAAGGKPRQMIV